MDTTLRWLTKTQDCNKDPVNFSPSVQMFPIYTSDHWLIMKEDLKKRLKWTFGLVISIILVNQIPHTVRDTKVCSLVYSLTCFCRRLYFDSLLESLESGVVDVMSMKVEMRASRTMEYSTTPWTDGHDVMTSRHSWWRHRSDSSLTCQKSNLGPKRHHDICYSLWSWISKWNR